MDKNILDFHGQPMFLVNVKKCLSMFPRVYVSSDDDTILEQASEVGALPIKRPQELCGDTPNIPVYRHAIEHIGGCDGFVAVQANSPTIDPRLIGTARTLLDLGRPLFQEIMTCHEDYSLYGSIWAMSVDKLNSYTDFYKPTPDILLKDVSIDIHDSSDYQKALCQK